MAGAAAVGLQPEWYALSQIALEGRLTSGQLAARTGLTTGATTRLIDRVERAGFVRRVADPADRRKVIVEAVPDAGARVPRGNGGNPRRPPNSVLTWPLVLAVPCNRVLYYASSERREHTCRPKLAQTPKPSATW